MKVGITRAAALVAHLHMSSRLGEPVPCLEEHRHRRKRADRDEGVGDGAEQHMVTAGTILGMNLQILGDEGMIVQKGDKRRRTRDDKRNAGGRKPAVGG